MLSVRIELTGFAYASRILSPQTFRFVYESDTKLILEDGIEPPRARGQSSAKDTSTLYSRSILQNPADGYDPSPQNLPNLYAEPRTLYGNNSESSRRYSTILWLKATRFFVSLKLLRTFLVLSVFMNRLL